MPNDVTILLLTVIVNFVRAMEFCIFLAVLFSWFPGSAKHPIVQFIRRVAEPILKIFRKILPRMGMIDFSPILAFFTLSILEGVLTTYIVSLSS